MMKIIRKINNNYALTRKRDGEVVVVAGRGIGFGTIPRYVTDESQIEKIYSGVDRNYIEQMGEMPENILKLSEKIVAYAKKNLTKKFSKNFVFTLADHIEFTIERIAQNMIFDFKGYYDFKYLYPREVEISKYAMKMIEEELKIKLPESELGGFVMNIVNSELKPSGNDEDVNFSPLISQITVIIEKYFNLEINRDSFNYSRFATHMIYLLRRLKDGKKTSDDNRRIYEKLLEEYPDTYRCVDEIARFLEQNIQSKLDENEMLYLILHVNRLCS